LSDGIAATTGLTSTSARPAATENITVPATSPIYAFSGKNVGIKAYIINPKLVSTGINLTVLCILKILVKKEKIRSIVSCVQKLIKTNVPRRVYDTLYISWNVTNSIGGKENADAMAINEK
jgi:hypothetical protein